MTTDHKICFGNSAKMAEVKDDSIHMVVTSPPYPMIAMWDDMFTSQNPDIAHALKSGSGHQAFEMMHLELDKVWQELIRVLTPGGILCINIGDAVRTINSDFRLYNNHSRITNFFVQKGMSNLPNIIWRKTTNAPNKFMGSGMLPSGAYVTLEHEYILIFRKGGKRVFASRDTNRQESAYFWEERNTWFSDLWEIKGSHQRMTSKLTRDRNGSFPFEIPYRLINMYSVKNDWVLDPFVGTGTSILAAMASARNCIGYEIDPLMKETIRSNIQNRTLIELNDYLTHRIKNHCQFVELKVFEKGKNHFKNHNAFHGFPVVSEQESQISIHLLDKITDNGDLEFQVGYRPKPAGGCNFFIEFAS